MNQHYGKALGHLLMAFGVAAFTERDEDGTATASDQEGTYGADAGPAVAEGGTPVHTAGEAPKRACCLAKRKVPALRRFKR